VNWTEPWLVALLSFHALTTVVLIATRKRHTFQIGLFMSLGAKTREGAAARYIG